MDYATPGGAGIEHLESNLETLQQRTQAMRARLYQRLQPVAAPAPSVVPDTVVVADDNKAAIAEAIASPSLTLPSSGTHASSCFSHHRNPSSFRFLIPRLSFFLSDQQWRRLPGGVVRASRLTR